MLLKLRFKYGNKCIRNYSQKLFFSHDENVLKFLKTRKLLYCLFCHSSSLLHHELKISEILKSSHKILNGVKANAQNYEIEWEWTELNVKTFIVEWCSLIKLFVGHVKGCSNSRLQCQNLQKCEKFSNSIFDKVFSSSFLET